MGEHEEGRYVDAEGTGQAPADPAQEKGNYTEVDEGDGVRAGTTHGEGSYTQGDQAGPDREYTDVDE